MMSCLQKALHPVFTSHEERSGGAASVGSYPARSAFFSDVAAFGLSMLFPWDKNNWIARLDFDAMGLLVCHHFPNWYK